MQGQEAVSEVGMHVPFVSDVLEREHHPQPPCEDEEAQKGISHRDCAA